MLRYSPARHRAGPTGQSPVASYRRGCTRAFRASLPHNQWRSGRRRSPVGDIEVERLIEQLAEVDAKSLRDPFDRTDRRTLSSALDLGDEGPVKTGLIGKLFLRPAFGLAESSHPFGKPTLDLHNWRQRWRRLLIYSLLISFKLDPTQVRWLMPANETSSIHD